MPLNYAVHQPLPGDACVELECAVAVGGGVIAKRDDERDVEFANARKSWDATEHGRNARGAQIRSVEPGNGGADKIIVTHHFFIKSL